MLKFKYFLWCRVYGYYLLTHNYKNPFQDQANNYRPLILFNLFRIENFFMNFISLIFLSVIWDQHPQNVNKHISLYMFTLIQKKKNTSIN